MPLLLPHILDLISSPPLSVNIASDLPTHLPNLKNVIHLNHVPTSSADLINIDIDHKDIENIEDDDNIEDGIKVLGLDWRKDIDQISSILSTISHSSLLWIYSCDCLYHTSSAPHLLNLIYHLTLEWLFHISYLTISQFTILYFISYLISYLM